MQSGHVPSDLPDALVQLRIFQIPGIIKFLPGLWNGSLLRDHPGVQRATNLSQTVHRAKRPHRSSGDPKEAEHLSLKFLETHQIECVL